MKPMNNRHPLGFKAQPLKDYKTSKTFLYAICFMLSCPSFLTSCGSAKPKVFTTKKEARKHDAYRTPSGRTSRISNNSEAMVAENEKVNAAPSYLDMVVAKALEFEGTRYKYGGTTRSGMDCSGLICTAYSAVDISMPRTSAAMYAQAEVLDLDALRKGDFIFFATGRNKRKVNHVAMVTQVTPAEIWFIHSTSSRGVIISSLNEPYWLQAYISAGRIE